jgi:hypothetical protein
MLRQQVLQTRLPPQLPQKLPVKDALLTQGKEKSPIFTPFLLGKSIENGPKLQVTFYVR